MGAGSEIGEDEIVVPVVEEEVVVEKRPVVREEIRIRKEVLEEAEVVEEDLRREEVHVERVPVSGEAAAGAEIGEDEIVVPITEEEVVVSKRPVVKEEIRIRKDVVEDTEVVEEDVRREEIDVEDQTSRRDT